MTEIDSATAQAQMCAWVLGQLMDFDRNEFGAEHALAVTGAYLRVTQLLERELHQSIGGDVRE